MKFSLIGGMAALLLLATSTCAQDETTVAADAPVLHPAPIKATVAPAPALAKLLKKLSGQHSPEGDQIVAAVHASSDLTEQLNALVAGGKLKHIDIVNGYAVGQFSAGFEGNRLELSQLLLVNLRVDHPHARIIGGEPPYLVADNTVFILGHLAWHMAHDSDQKANADQDMQAALDEAYANAKPGEAPDMTNILNNFTNGSMRNEAAAYLQGWNDTVDAAARAKGSPLTPEDAAAVLMNLRYRAYFLAAMPDSGDKLTFSDDGRVALDGPNLTVMAAALGKQAVPDFQ